MNQEPELVKPVIDSISKTFCAAKFKQVTLHMTDGYTHSCYHPLRHPITDDDLTHVDGIHNTAVKLAEQAKMLKGERPPGCSFCWSLEDAGSLSDRHTKSGESWAWPHISRLAKLKPGERINPSYVELSFSSTCQMRCSYCNPSISSAWATDIEKHGTGFGGVDGWYNHPEKPRFTGENPYVKSFWNWWNAGLSTDIEVLRVTGGEPLLDENTWTLFKKLKDEPSPWLEFNINSNMMVGKGLISQLIHAVNGISRNVKDFILFTSVDTTGAKAEYARNGLRWDDHVEACERFLTETSPVFRNGNKLAYMCTFTIFSLPRFQDLLVHILEQKKRWRMPDGAPRVFLDINVIDEPIFFQPYVAAPRFLNDLRACVYFMKDHPEFNSFEVSKMERLVNLLSKTVVTEDHARRIKHLFKAFTVEHDRRRKTDFKTTFPELESCRDV